jgi:hypothetical protein
MAKTTTKKTFSARTRREVTGLLEDTLRQRQEREARLRAAYARDPALRATVVEAFMRAFAELRAAGELPPPVRKRKG